VTPLAVHFRRTGASFGATLEGPAVAASGHVALAWDGRIDNREEFGSHAGVAPADLPRLTDEALVLVAYERAGVDALAHLVGDYAFILWDARERAVLCARDPLAQRPLFYYLSGSSFIAASSVAGVLAHSEVPRAPNEGVVAEYLFGSMATRDETLFAGVRRLIPGTWIRVDSASERRGTIAWVDPHAEIRYRHEDEYAEHLRELLRVAVRARLAGVVRAGVELSGGLDSSTVSAIARRELGNDAPDRLVLLSLVFPGLSCDERPLIEACHRAWRLPSHVVVAGGSDAANTAHEYRHLDFPCYPNGTMSEAMRRRARAEGIRVILTGIGGDEWFSGNRYHLADDLRRGRIWRAIRQARIDAEVEPAFGWLAGLWSYGVVPSVPRAVKQLVRPMRASSSPTASWMPDGFVARTDLGGRLRVRPQVPEFPTVAQAEMFRSAVGGWAIHGTEMEVRQARELGVELRHPLSDLRLARFALAIPESQRWRGRERKRVLRAAATGLVPDAVRLAHSKVDFTPLVVQALEAQGGAAFFRHLGTAALGWVDPEPLHRMYAEMLCRYAAGDLRYIDSAWILWMIGGIERWARAAGFVEGGNYAEHARQAS
jgi:asparagine synthase (glutamine-hydrolysing)